MQIGLNLVSNAINNTYEGKVTISCDYAVHKQQIIFEVDDTGIGIKQVEQDQVFKIFKDSG